MKHWKCPFCDKKLHPKGKGVHLKTHGYKIDYIQQIGLTDKKAKELRELRKKGLM